MGGEFVTSVTISDDQSFLSLAPYGIIGMQVPALVVVTRATVGVRSPAAIPKASPFLRFQGCDECHETQTGCVRIQNAGTPLVATCQRCHVKNHTCVTFKGRFDFTLTGSSCPLPHSFDIDSGAAPFADHVISVVNAELLDMYADSLLAAFSSFTGIDVASRLIARSIIYRQDALLEGRRAPRTDAPAAEEPIEHHVDVLLRKGRGRESYIEHSLVPFRGTQFGDCQHQLPLPAMQDANNAAMYMTHMVEDLVDRISAGARGMGGSFNQRVTQAFHPEWCVHLPENFEVGDHRPGGRSRASTVSADPSH
jgi:hypothetical protein